MQQPLKYSATSGRMSPSAVKKERRFGWVFFLSICLMIITTLAQGHSYALYVVVMTAAILVTLFLFLKRLPKYNQFFALICLYCLVVPTLIGLFGASIQDAPMAAVSVFLPLIFSTMTINTEKTENACWHLALFMLVLNFAKPYIPLLNGTNVNVFSFIMFMGLIPVLLLIRYRCTFPRLLLLLISVYIFTTTGSRNAFVTFALIAIISLLPYDFVKSTVFFRIFYIICLGYQIVSEGILRFFETNPFFSGIFENYIQPLFHKYWGLDSRVEIYESVSRSIWGQDLFHLLFGNGCQYPHAHNGFFQMMYMYGLVGTILLLVMYVCIFEMALRVIRAGSNRLAAGCALALGGLFLLQGADVFMLGCKTCAFVPFLLAGLIINEYNKWGTQESPLSSVAEKCGGTAPQDLSPGRMHS